MGLTCSVLGHRYGEREHIEERDRQGSEEVIAMREVKTCERCGDELVVSESKEVLAVTDDREEGEQPSIDDADPQPPSAEEHIEEPTITDDSIDSPEDDEGVILRDDADREPGEWPPVEETEEDTDGAEDVEWPLVENPDPDEDESGDPGPWPEVETEDEGFDAVAGDIDPEHAAEVIETATPEQATGGQETEAGFVRAEAIDSPTNPDQGDVHTEFFCPRCDWTAKTLTTSVRRGDICPDCRTGYIAERET